VNNNPAKNPNVCVSL